ncbi:MAG: hypothetical protein K9L17_07810 [Clostridiales bacterium]|nr:hypothetical protein [Clostridiales bacterium]MCF8022578.1 hypothetical protein [Clostridiales bacterium]
MLKSKLLLFIGLTALMLFSLSAGSYALFSSEAISSGNTVSAGTLYIGGENGNKGMLDKTIKLENMLPGGEQGEAVFKIKNLGSMKVYINGISVNIKESREKFLSNALSTRCFEGNNLLYQGSLLALDSNVVPLDKYIVLEPGETTALDFSIQLDEMVSNWYKGKNIEFSLTVYAAQRPDQEVGKWALIPDKDKVPSVVKNAEPGDTVLVPAGEYGRLSVKPGVTVKAKDVIYNTVVKEFIVSPGASKVQARTAKAKRNVTLLQGFTINSPACGIKVQSSQNCKVLDNIINSSDNPLKVNGAGKVLLSRNDMTGCFDKNFGKKNISTKKAGKNKIQFDYNLGVDLKPEDHAL